MSKNKGNKNHKKAPANKADGKVKVLSAYKSEGKEGVGSDPALDVFATKNSSKKGGSSKPK